MGGVCHALQICHALTASIVLIGMRTPTAPPSAQRLSQRQSVDRTPCPKTKLNRKPDQPHPTQSKPAGA
eukprot:3091622-Pyramimonas_sp.AAC.1